MTILASECKRILTSLYRMYLNKIEEARTQTPLPVLNSLAQVLNLVYILASLTVLATDTFLFPLCNSCKYFQDTYW